MNYKKIFKNREKRLKLINRLSFVPTKLYLKLVFRITTGRKLHLNKPVLFSEKINWLKINKINSEYTKYVDKLQVRDIIAKEIGEEYLIPLLGEWKRFEDIDFNALPERFVLKCNHDSGSTKIISDKNNVDKEELKKFFQGRLKLNSYNISREYPYRNVSPCIIAEEFMVDESNDELKDYKFFCFHGEPKIMYIASGRNKNETKFSFFDMDFQPLSIEKHVYKNSNEPFLKPSTLEEMKKICRQLSKDLIFVRLDFYSINGKIYFGEYTFFPAGGFYLFEPLEWEIKLGEYLNLS